MKRILTLWAKRWRAHFAHTDREVCAMLDDLISELEGPPICARFVPCREDERICMYCGFKEVEHTRGRRG